MNYLNRVPKYLNVDVKNQLRLVMLTSLVTKFMGASLKWFDCNICLIWLPEKTVKNRPQYFLGQKSNKTVLGIKKLNKHDNSLLANGR